MNESVRQLVGILDEMAELHERLIELSTEKTDVLGSPTADALSLITNRESRLIAKLAELEKERVLGVSRFLYQSGLAATPSFRLEQLIQMVYKADEKKALTEAARRLRDAVARLQAVHQFNQQLLKLNMNYVQLSLDLITGPFEEEATYHRSVQNQSFKRAGQFDTKA